MSEKTNQQSGGQMKQQLEQWNRDVRAYAGNISNTLNDHKLSVNLAMALRHFENNSKSADLVAHLFEALHNAELKPQCNRIKYILKDTFCINLEYDKTANKVKKDYSAIRYNEIDKEDREYILVALEDPETGLNKLYRDMVKEKEQAAPVLSKDDRDKESIEKFVKEIKNRVKKAGELKDNLSANNCSKLLLELGRIQKDLAVQMKGLEDAKKELIGKLQSKAA